MKKLILSALIVGAASQAAGCIIVDGDAQGDATVSWNLLSADANGNPIPSNCLGATTAVVYALETGADPSQAYQDKYLCSDGAGRAADLPPGSYAIWVRLTDTAETTLFAESGSLIANVVDGGTTPVALDIFTDHAFYTASWKLVPAGGGANPTCGQVVGEDGVSIIATYNGGAFIDSVVDCESGEGTNVAITDPLPINIDYTVSVALINAQNQRIGISATIPPSDNTDLNYGNKYADLGVLDINLD